MEFRHLRYFVAVAEERSFTKAADRLWVAQPALSTQIRRLEAELGLQLFQRRPRGVDLTDAGELVLERARAALAAAETVSSTKRDLETGVVGSIRLGLATGASWSGTAALLDRYARHHGGVELGVLEGHGGLLWHKLRGGRLDAVIAPAIFASADLRGAPLGAEPWAVLVGDTHRLAQCSCARAEDLVGEQIAVTAHRDGAGLDRAIAELLRELHIAAALVRTPPGPALALAVAACRAVALTTAPQSVHPAVRAVPLDCGRSLAFELLWRDEPVSPALAEFVRLATERGDQRGRQRRGLTAVA